MSIPPSAGPTLLARLNEIVAAGNCPWWLTASGVVPTYLVTLARVEIGSIVLGNVACAVLEVDAPVLDEVLIGNSFLNQVQMQRNGSTMVLTRSNVF